MTLTQTAALTRRAIVGFLIFILLIFFGFALYQVYYNLYYLPRKPVPVTLPQVNFGALPKVNLPESTTSAKNYSFSLNTQTGNLPTNFPKLVKVFFVPQLGTTLLAQQKIQDLASSLGFNNSPDVSNITSYHFTNNSSGNLYIDLNTANFTFERASTDSATLVGLSMPSQDQITSDFKAFLSVKGLLKQSLAGGRTSVTYNSPNVANATQAEITLWPENLENLQIVTPDFSHGLITATVTKATDESFKYPKLTFTFWAPDPQTASTYPIKTVDEAFKELKNGDGFVAQPPTTGKSVSILNVYLAYLETADYSPYIQPLYVFQGPDFVGYVSAVTSQYQSK